MKTPEELYKLRKEAFVSNLTGGSITEINLVTAIAPVSYVFFAVLQSRLCLFTSYGPAQLAIDFLINCVLVLLATTLYSAQPLLLSILVLSPAVLIYFTTSKPPKTARPNISKSKDVVEGSEKSQDLLPKKAFLTVYRGSMMVITCVAILAVDFHVFPRRFAKVENWGTSLMDLGVGSFVFSSGLVSARTVVKQYLASSSRPVSFLGRMKTAMRSSLPLLVLGFVRLAMVKGVDYAEHVTEYGVHWNFFFTLGFLPPFVALLQSIPTGNRNPTVIYTVLTLLVAVGYQIVLKTTGLEEYVLVGDRHKYGLLGMNKEGASSFAGYLAIFLAGMSSGTYVLPRDDAVDPKKSKMLKTMLGWAAFWVFAFIGCNEYQGLGIGVSRRLANLSYVLWVAAFNTTQLVAFYLVERLLLSKRQTGVVHEKEAYKFNVPRVLNAFNRNGLAVFLMANLLTGLVNVTIKTLDMGRVEAMGILTAYLAAVGAVALALDYKDMSIKL
ncbi:GWT1-domain-containing protein [Tricharina praecox]|uniref:GWT1-domain-containing protein n=1 Tax=Tricharina praecox TaxID=43433 RepID=UPI00221EF6AD|nr:GWT1-domain-containing protein [Tricharina praecox]KAI5853895.1 GWT1-domain-containing protein [Tricharina praecox]